jgi:hypothetical protein
VIGEKLMADIVEVADEGYGHAEPVEPLADLGYGGGGLVAVDGDAHDLGARAGERRDLLHRRVHIRRVRVGHRLDHDRRAAADHDGPDAHAHGAMARSGAGEALWGGSGLRGRKERHAAIHDGRSKLPSFS